MLHRKIVDQVASLKVVGGVEGKIGVRQQLLDVFRGQVGDLGFYVNVRVESPDLLCGGNGFGQRLGCVSFVE